MAEWDFYPLGPGVYEADYGCGRIWVRVFESGRKLKAWLPVALLDEEQAGSRASRLVLMDDAVVEDWMWLELKVPDWLPAEAGGWA